LIDRLRFGRDRRLLTPAHYTAVFDGRQTIRGSYLVLHFKAQPEQPLGAVDGATVACSRSGRLGLVIPKKNARRAIWRNTIKRQIREAFRHRCDLPDNVDIVVRLAKALPINLQPVIARAAVRKEIEQLLDKLLQRAALPPRTPMAPHSSPAGSPA
jgi:ribonuclease P protein component